MDQQSAIEEIALIKRVIDESRRFAFDNGKYYLLWGALITLAIFAEYALILTNNAGISELWLWIATIGIGWLISTIFGMRERSRPGSWPIGAKLIAVVWMSTGVAMTIIGFVGPMSGGLHSWAICPALAAVMGGSYTISSLVYRLRWVTFVGIAWWLGSLVMFFVKGINTLPIFGFMMILFQFIPGLIFYRSWKRNLTTSDSK
jgi:hypothetical protein